MNFPSVPTSRLHLWTFGAPQVADDVFLNSAIDVTPRLRRFVKENGNGHFHRFVTLSDDCKVDVVSEVTKNTLASHKENTHGRAARRFGGVHGHVVHFAEPHYLLTPSQIAMSSVNNSDYDKGASSTRSTVAAHAIGNYLSGISRESVSHPLRHNLLPKMAEYVEGGVTTE